MRVHEVIVKAFLISVWKMIGRWLGVGESTLLGPAPAFYDLARAVGSADVALFIQKVDGWCAHNERKNSLRHFHEGSWWSYNSYKAWATDLNMGWTASVMRRVIERAEKTGVVIGVQRTPGKPKWYRVDHVRRRKRRCVYYSPDGTPQRAKWGFGNWS